MKHPLKKIKPVAVIVAPTVVGLLVFSTWPLVTEKIYSEFFYVGITRVMTWCFGWIPFSVSEIVIILLVPTIFIWIVLIVLRKIRFVKAIYILVLSISVLFSWFYFSWGFNYLRQPMSTRLQLSQAVVDTALVKQALQGELTEANESFLVYENLDEEKIDQEIERCYRVVEKQLGISLPGGIRRPKHMFIHAILNKTMTSGVFSPFFHEVHVNMELLPIEYPFVLAHEKAHQMGIANEAEANFLAYLVCMASPMPEEPPVIRIRLPA